MIFIIIDVFYYKYCNNFEYFLFVHIILYKGDNKVCCIAICYCEFKLEKLEKAY